jgi:hypothetical protein
MTSQNPQKNTLYGGTKILLFGILKIEYQNIRYKICFAVCDDPDFRASVGGFCDFLRPKAGNDNDTTSEEPGEKNSLG